VKLEALHITAIAVCGLVACGSGSDRTDERLGGLVKAHTEVVEPVNAERAAADPAELRHALTQPHHRLAAALGAHQFHGTSKVRVNAGGEQVEALDDETSIDYAADGSFHAQLDNSHDYGREIYFVGGELYLRPRYSKYHRRAPNNDGEPGELCDEIYATLGDYFDLVSHAAKPEDRGAVTQDGRPAHKIGIGLADAPRPHEQTAEQKKWREEAVVDRLTGEVVVDDATGAVLQGTLHAEVAFVREGTTYAMTLDVTHAIGAIGGTVEVTAPPDDQTVATRIRPHELEERNELLEGIAAPARKAPTK